MTVSTTPSRISYVGNGVTTSFNFPYYTQSQNDLKLAVYDTVLDTITPLVLNTDYTLSGASTPGFGYEAGLAALVPGGTPNVPAVLPATSKLTIYRDPSELQNLGLPVNSPYVPEPIESNFDAIVLMLQRLRDWLSRAVTLPDGFSGTFNPQLPKELPGVANAGSTLITDPTGQFFIVGPNLADLSSAGDNATAAAASAVAAAASDADAVAAAVQSTQSAADAAANLQAMQAIALTFPVFAIVGTAGGDVVENLPQASAATAMLAFVNKSFGSGHNVVVTAHAGDNIMGAATDNVSSGDTRWYLSDKINTWYLVN